MRDEAEHLVLLAGQQLSDEFTVAATILAAAGGTRPKRPLRLLIDFRLRHLLNPFAKGMPALQTAPTNAALDVMGLGMLSSTSPFALT
ncbi:hypothetical protein [Rhizobium leguminosarum]|uniref:hypothetical protein n=1 Tax=Rhizobium leguminosarum TaxID=384 RepID=UPI001FED4091|nr:hypothetical protein [Rhizobium leguminosarum]